MFEDRSEVGDGWFHAHAVNDEQLLSTSAQVAVVHDGPEIVTFRATITLRPELVITNRISLRRGARTVDVETIVDNNAEDHRLKLLLPTDVPAKTYLAHHPYDFVERAIALDAESVNWQEMEQSEKPFLGLQAIGAGQRGLAFISAGGLHEGGVIDDARRTMQVTLLRSFRKTVSTAGEHDGLELGRIVYRYALMPFAGKLPRATALAELAKLQAGIFTRQTGKRPSGFPPMTGPAPATQGFIKAGKLVVSAIKPPETGDGVVIRLWNPTDRPQRDRLEFSRSPKKVTTLKLNEDAARVSCAKLAGKTVTVEAGPHQIVTLRIT
jgi:alpha-mannosidase